MNKYELVVIVDAAITQEDKEAVIKEAQDIIVKGEGKIINSQVWIDKHKFSFSMKKRYEGTYYLVNFESAASKIARIRQLLRLNEKILRSSIVKAE